MDPILLFLCTVISALTSGIKFRGKVEEVNNQWIETKFFALLTPIFPLSSMLITAINSKNEREGIEIKLHRTSVIAGYLRTLFFIISISSWFATISLAKSDFFLIIALVFGGLWSYFQFSYGKATPTEIEGRKKLGNAIGIYALPNWFDDNSILNFYKDLEFKYKETFKSNDWKSDLNSDFISNEKVPFLYAISVFNFYIHKSAENETLLKRADNLYLPLIASENLKS